MIQIEVESHEYLLIREFTSWRKARPFLKKMKNSFFWINRIRRIKSSH